ncbi:hypothetical protein [Evansella halocellulosilytica]|uniref:hypothetical protein n=1 Tax=Evansella halocellulosilytica TaxID=2011013 RepID=UPI000BB9A529|nr:hypothetical protein [Evansella halocellulosilytica]
MKPLLKKCLKSLKLNIRETIFSIFAFEYEHIMNDESFVHKNYRASSHTSNRPEIIHVHTQRSEK